MKKDLSEFTEAMTHEVSELTTAAKGGIDTAANAVKQQAQYLEKLVTPDEEKANAVGEESQKEEDKEKNEQKEDQPESSQAENEHTKVTKSNSIGFGFFSKIVETVTDTVKNLAIEETTRDEDKITEEIKRKAHLRKTNIGPDRLNQIQSSESTYLSEPENEEAFLDWIQRFKIDEYDAEINMLLANNPPMRQIYAKLVPAKLENDDFWARYFYAVELAEADEELKQSFQLQQLTIKTDRKENGKNDKEDSPKRSNDSRGSPSSQKSDNSMSVVEQPQSPSHTADDWSVCSDKQVEEITSQDEEEDRGLLTPKGEKKQKEDGWVDWDE
ncbi:hypothetical protein WR25_17710 isoform C [Diploscapter pachys]|uniref:BSD domain-containing protein n=1 Tax=Diploscapter pachys TaxID=2018661 RepID=A0A2A2LA78_9BILA|nr:hypothetical protein WR25_17710 isoform A [Diploscapter pachys]PAV82948.1 hypothetical protein WR25_17710 isoform B [Diploscapter pachys]PAV82949.1 hypothetical protein WR25_17710 isoform C [Diploscapter pachys]